MTIIQSTVARGASASVTCCRCRSTISNRHFLFANEIVVDISMAAAALVVVVVVGVSDIGVDDGGVIVDVVIAVGLLVLLIDEYIVIKLFESVTSVH
jgi:hypothetical protein